MRRILSIILLLFTALAFSQSDKDSLLQKDFNEVYDKLKLMHYLERAAMEYYSITDEGRIISEKTFPYYLKKNVISTNPVPSIDILKYLGIYLNKDIPCNWNDFVMAVNNANAKSLLEITEKYGYPSNPRIAKLSGLESTSTCIVFTIRKNKYAQDIEKMIKKEYKKGVISESEYNIFKALNGREALSTKEVQELTKNLKKAP
ncbi:hypothetical protein D3C87_405120 [compost metagenome]